VVTTAGVVAYEAAKDKMNDEVYGKKEEAKAKLLNY
jgi:hypothetical protein